MFSVLEHCSSLIFNVWLYLRVHLYSHTPYITVTMADVTENGHHSNIYAKFEPLPEGSLNEDGQPALNKFSYKLTKGHDYPGAQVGLSICIFEISLC
jgi:hypothetical protein